MKKHDMKKLENYRKTLAIVNANKPKQRKKLCLFSVKTQEDKYFPAGKVISSVPLSDAAIAYLDKVSSILAYTAIRTNYINSGHPYMLELMYQGQQEIKNSEYRDTLESLTYCENLQFVKLHNRKKIHGIMCRVPEYGTIENTETGKKIYDIPVVQSNDFSDCKSVAMIYLLELAEKGILVDYDSVWNVRTLVYRKVNAYIMRERKNARELQDYRENCIFYESDGREVVYTGNAIEKRLSCIDTDDILSLLSLSIEKKAKELKGKDPEKLKKILYLRAEGLTEGEIAERENISKTSVFRSMQFIKKCAFSHYGIDAISFLMAE